MVYRQGCSFCTQNWPKWDGILADQGRRKNVVLYSTDDKISDLKDRLTAIESRTSGITAANSANRDVSNDSTGRMLSVVAILISAVTAAVLIATHFH